MLIFGAAMNFVALMLSISTRKRETPALLIAREELMNRLEKRTDEREREKRSKFQYDVDEMAKRGCAETSLQRARDFVSEVGRIRSRTDAYRSPRRLCECCRCSPSETGRLSFVVFRTHG